MVPMLREATSGLKVAAGLTRSSTVMPIPPPVVRFTMQLERCLITLRNGAKASGVWSGRPSLGLRACRCTIAAPASAAPTAASAISSAVMGRCGDIDGVWIEPVTAQVIMTLRPLAIAHISCDAGYPVQSAGSLARRLMANRYELRKLGKAHDAAANFPGLTGLSIVPW